MSNHFGCSQGNEYITKMLKNLTDRVEIQLCVKWYANISQSYLDTYVLGKKQLKWCSI